MPRVICKIKNDVKVQPGLSLSPSQIERLTAQGHAAALGSLDGYEYYDSLPPGADVPIEDKRGVDINVIWRHSKAAQQKINEARQKANMQQTSTTIV